MISVLHITVTLKLAPPLAAGAAEYTNFFRRDRVQGELTSALEWTLQSPELSSQK
jgi:hypothetical protein